MIFAKFNLVIKGFNDMFSTSHPYPDNSPPGQFPTIQVLALMSGFIPWYLVVHGENQLWSRWVQGATRK